MDITIVRHAESEYNRDGIWAGRADCALTQKGIEAAQELGKTLDTNFDVIYCSPLKRTKQTLFAIVPDADPVYDDRIIEISIGEWENTNKSLYSEQQRELFRKGLLVPPGAESHKDVDKRVCSFLSDVFEKYKEDERILVVTHAGVIRSIKRSFLNITKNIQPSNLDTLVLTPEDYKNYLYRMQESER